MVVNATPMASSEGMIYPVDRLFGALERPGAEAGRAEVDMVGGCDGGAYGRTVRDDLADSSGRPSGQEQNRQKDRRRAPRCDPIRLLRDVKDQLMWLALGVRKRCMWC